MTDLRVGLVGYGVAGAFFHAPLISATPGLRLSAVVTGDPERAAEVSGKYGARVAGDAAELWDSVDLVVIASPTVRTSCWRRPR